MRKSILLLAAAVIAAPAAASAADLYVPPPAPAPIPAAAGIWEGLYVGVHAGYVTVDADHQPVTPPASPYQAGYDLNPTGWLLGAQIGANFYLSDTVVGGVVADISWSNATDSSTFSPGPGVVSHDINWEGSLRAKLGFDGGTFMPYLTGGLAVANATREAFTTDTQTHIGWTVGAGVDFAVADNVSLNLEYRYSDYGSKVYGTGGTAPTVDLTSHAVRAGVNFHF